MSVNSEESNVETIFNNFNGSLELAINQLKDETFNRNTENFEAEAFWMSLLAAAKGVNQESTKFCMAFSKPPIPDCQSCRTLIQSLENSCLALLAVFFKLPRTEGEILYKDVRLSVLCLLQSVQELCTEAKQMRASQLKAIGNVWERCSSIEHLDKDNKAATLNLLNNQLTTVQDALEEIQEALNENAPVPDEEPPRINGFHSIPTTWTVADRQMLPACIGLIRAAKGALKKTILALREKGACSSHDNIVQIDCIGRAGKPLSSHVDDFVMALYPPVLHSVVCDNAKVLGKQIAQLLKSVSESHINDEEQQKWITFIEEALIHNLRNIGDISLEN